MCPARSPSLPAWLPVPALPLNSEAQQRTLLESRYVRSLLDLLDGVTRTVRLRKQLAPAQVGGSGPSHHGSMHCPVPGLQPPGVLLPRLNCQLPNTKPAPTWLAAMPLVLQEEPVRAVLDALGDVANMAIPAGAPSQCWGV